MFGYGIKIWRNNTKSSYLSRRKKDGDIEHLNVELYLKESEILKNIQNHQKTR